MRGGCEGAAVEGDSDFNAGNRAAFRREDADGRGGIECTAGDGLKGLGGDLDARRNGQGFWCRFR